MFKSSVPVFLASCALALSLWPSFAGTSSYAAFGWALGGVVMLYALSILIERRHGSTQSVEGVLEEAARLNATRVRIPAVTAREGGEVAGR